MGRVVRELDVVQRASARWLGWYASIAEEVRDELDAELGSLSPSCFDPAYPRTRSEDATWALLAARRVDEIFASPERAARAIEERRRHVAALAEAALGECAEAGDVAHAMFKRLDRSQARWKSAEQSWRALRRGWLSDEQLAGEIVAGRLGGRGSA